DWDGLEALVSAPDVLAAAYRFDLDDLKVSWAALEAAGRSMPQAYAAVLAGPTTPDVTWEVARLLADSGYVTDPITLQRRLVDDAPNVSPARLGAALGNLAAALLSVGDLDGAAPVLDEQESVARSLGDDHLLTVCLGNRAVLARSRGESDAALA